MCDLLDASAPPLHVQFVPASVGRKPTAAEPIGRLIIALTGRAGVGKSTLAALLADQLAIRRGSATRCSFAAPMRAAVAAIFGSTYSTQADKAAPDPYWTTRLGPDWSTGRQILQRFGTEVCRDHISQDIWALALQRRINAERLHTVIIDDCRFDNEAAMVHRLGGWVIRLDRSGLPPVPAHSSEGGVRWQLVDRDYSLDTWTAGAVVGDLLGLCTPASMVKETK
jgi:hypothetical protein